MKRSTIVLIVLAIVLTASVVAAGFLMKPKAKSVDSLPQGNPDDIAKASSSGLPYVVKLGSEDCDACKLIDPVLAKLASELEGRVKFIKIDVYKYPKVAVDNKVNVIPTLLYYAPGGTKKGTTQGFMDDDKIKGILSGYGMI